MVDLCVVKGAPPKVLWLRVGNCATALISEVLETNDDRIRRFHDDEDHVVLSLFRFASIA